MGTTVIINYMTASNKGSSGKSIAFPDVCKTPVLGVPVPIPYPNIAQSSDLASGSKKVKFDGQSVCIKGCNLSRSMGDEPGVQMGILSNTQMGKAEFVNYSFDVKVEGSNVCRLLDPTTNNMSSLNAAAFAHLQAPATAMAGDAPLINDACKALKDKLDSQNKKNPKEDASAGGPKSAGIWEPHWDAMMEVVSDESEAFYYLLYFRQNTVDAVKRISEGKGPKTHAVMDGNSLKAVDDPTKDLRPALRQWLARNVNGVYTPIVLRAVDDRLATLKWLDSVRGDSAAGRHVPVPKTHVGEVTLHEDKCLGIIIRTSEGRRGMPQPVDDPKEARWMTSDYDLMDVYRYGKPCERPYAEDFNGLQLLLNGFMGWEGIQHPYQAAYNTRKDPHFKPSEKKDDEVFEFNNMAAIDAWLNDPKVIAAKKALSTNAGTLSTEQVDAHKKTINAVPKTRFASGRGLNSLIDDKLTILGPNGGLFLKESSDFWDALVCSGCLDKNKQEQDRDKIEGGMSEDEAAKHRKDGKHGKNLDLEAAKLGKVQPVKPGKG